MPKLSNIKIGKKEMKNQKTKIVLFILLK